MHKLKELRRHIQSASLICKCISTGKCHNYKSHTDPWHFEEKHSKTDKQTHQSNNTNDLRHIRYMIAKRKGHKELDQNTGQNTKQQQQQTHTHTHIWSNTQNERSHKHCHRHWGIIKLYLALDSVVVKTLTFNCLFRMAAS